MTKHGIVRSACSLGAVCALVLVTSPAAAQSSAVHKPRSADQSFIDMMVPHHQQASEMAQQAVAKATRPEVKQLAQKMLDEQGKEIAQLKNWRRQWFGSDSTPPAMRSAEMPSGPEFDRIWLREMIKHHGMGVTVAEITERSTARAQIKQIATKTSNSQHEDRHKMAAWLMQWYNEPAPVAAPPRKN